MFSVLVVDDEELIRVSFRRLINWEKYGLTLVKECINGKEALDYMINNPVDILLTDIKMPVMDGITLLEELNIRNITRKATIILSAFDEYDLVRSCFKLKADDYILKSNYDEDDIIKIILNIINKNSPPEIKEENNYSHEINQVLDYLNKNFHRNISLKDISDYVCYSESYLSHLFSKEIGITVTEYLNTLRVEKAKYLLSTSNLKIYEVSSKVGFQSVEHFSRIFKKYAGTSPKQFRYS